MVSPERVLAEVEKLRAESSAGGAKNPNFDVSLEFGFGVIHGRDQAYEMVLETIQELMSKEEDKENE